MEYEPFFVPKEYIYIVLLPYHQIDLETSISLSYFSTLSTL